MSGFPIPFADVGSAKRFRVGDNIYCLCEMGWQQGQIIDNDNADMAYKIQVALMNPFTNRPMEVFAAPRCPPLLKYADPRSNAANCRYTARGTTTAASARHHPQRGTSIWPR